MITKFIALALIAATLTACAAIGPPFGAGGNVFPPHPDWAKDAWERQGEGGN